MANYFADPLAMACGPLGVHGPHSGCLKFKTFNGLLKGQLIAAQIYLVTIEK